MFDNKFTKRDALAESVKQVMLENEIRRQVEFTLNEQLGIHSKNALPHEQHAQYDAMLNEAIKDALSEGMWPKKNMEEEHPPYSEKQERLAKLGTVSGHGGNPEKIDDKDLKAARKGHAHKVGLEEASADKLRRYIKGAEASRDAAAEKFVRAPKGADRKAGGITIQKRMAGMSMARAKLTGEPYAEKPGISKTKTEPKVLAREESLEEASLEARKAVLARAKKRSQEARKDVGDVDPASLSTPAGQRFTKASGREASAELGVQRRMNPAFGKKKLEEKLTKSMSAGDVISDFVHSKNPKFAGKSKKERQKMALGAYYGMHPEKSRKQMDESLESILEEIALNLQEQFVYIYENGDYAMMNEFLGSLTEEQAELLGLNEATPGNDMEMGAALRPNPQALQAARAGRSLDPNARQPVSRAEFAAKHQQTYGATARRESDALYNKSSGVRTDGEGGSAQDVGSNASKPAAPAPAAPVPAAPAPQAAAPAPQAARPAPRPQPAAPRPASSSEGGAIQNRSSVFGGDRG